MNGSLFLSAARRGDHFQVRPARNEDWSALERLLQYADRQYLALEWWTVQEWLGSPTLLLSTDRDGRPVGLILTIANVGPVAWVRAIAALTKACLPSLLQASVQAALVQGCTGLATLGDEDWLVSQLRRTDFRPINHVVTLRCKGDWPEPDGPKDLVIRTAARADLEVVLELDHVAFAPLWWYGREVLRRALNRALSFDVAYRQDCCVGYLISTLRHGRGHIVRLATHPNWRRQGISGRLLSQAIEKLNRAGAEQITVNTQQDNLASLRLYRRFNFARIGRPWTVWFRSLEQP